MHWLSDETLRMVRKKQYASKVLQAMVLLLTKDAQGTSSGPQALDVSILHKLSWTSSSEMRTSSFSSDMFDMFSFTKKVDQPRQLSLSQGCLPSDWTSANIMPASIGKFCVQLRSPFNPSSRTLCLQLVRKLLIQARTCPLIPTESNLSSKRWWGTLSKALDKSRYTTWVLCGSLN